MSDKELQKLIDSQHKYVDGISEIVKKGADDASNKLVKMLTAYIDKMPSKDGKLKKGADSTRLINKLRAEIDDIIAKSSFPDAVKEVVRSLPQIEENAKIVLNALNPEVDINWSKLNISTLQTAQANTIVENMTGGPLSQYVKEPLTQALYRNVYLGATLSETKEYLMDYLLMSADDKYGRMARYATQMAQDALMQYDGLIYDNFKTTYETNAVRYIGSLIQDSRPQCRRWINNNRGIILNKNLQNEIDWANTNGSGMYPGTMPFNFCTYRGGYRCRHRAIPVFMSESDLKELKNGN